MSDIIKEITEKLFIWDKIKKISASKPVILYGMGDGADKILNICADKSIKISGVFASDGFARGNYFRGFKVLSLAETEELYKNFCILTAFATREPEVIDRIYKLSEKYELYAPNFPVYGGGDYPDYDFFARNIGEINQAYTLLADNKSREVYINAINFMISGDIKYLRIIQTPKSEALDLLDLKNGLYYIDAGAYDGDTILELNNYFAGKSAYINKITAFEPDKKNFAKLEKNIRENNLEKIADLYNIGVWSEKKPLIFEPKSGRGANLSASGFKNPDIICADSINNILSDKINGETPILLKYDVEGAESEALEGARFIIEKYAPDIIISVYHRTEDIFKILLDINKINPGYDFYMRKHRYIPCWDLNLYAKSKYK